MRFFAPAETRTPLCFGSRVRLGAGLLVPLFVAPALAQESPPAIVVSPSQAGRVEREKLAPATIAQAEVALQAAQAADIAAFEETVKRLRDVEASDPARALAEYRRFLVGRNPSAALGVQVGIKVAQMRQKMGDFQGALFTCDVLGRKYALEPSVALLSLQKARVLMSQKQVAQASQCIDEAVPDLLALGPGHYVEVSDFLLQLAQTNLKVSTGDRQREQKWAQTLCVDTEDFYLRWIKKDTIDHLWQRFEALQVVYLQAGDDERAEELLPKVGDALLQLPPKPGNIEGAVLSLEAARWLSQKGQSEQAAVFYKRVPEFGDSWHIILALYDQAWPLIGAGKLQEAKVLLSQPLNLKSDEREGEVARNAWLAQIAYQQGHLDEAARYGQQVVQTGKDVKFSHSWIKSFYDLGKDVYNRAGSWKTQPIQSDVKQLIVKINPSQPDRPLYARFRIKTYGRTIVTAKVNDPTIQVRVLPIDNWRNNALEDKEEESEVIIQCNSAKHSKQTSIVLNDESYTASPVVVVVSLVPEEGTDTK